MYVRDRPTGYKLYKPYLYTPFVYVGIYLQYQKLHDLQLTLLGKFSKLAAVHEVLYYWSQI